MDLYNFIYLEEPANYPVCTSARLFGWVSLFTITEKKDSSKLEIKFVEPVLTYSSNKGTEYLPQTLILLSL